LAQVAKRRGGITFLRSGAIGLALAVIMARVRSSRRTVLLLGLALAFFPHRGDSALGSARGAEREVRARTAPVAVRAELSPLPISEPEHGPACSDRIQQALAEPAEPGAPKLDENRGVVLLYAKAEPVLFTRTPEPQNRGSEAAQTYRTMLRTTSSPWTILDRLWPVFSQNPELGRAVLLRDGYLYADKPELAFALVDLVTVQMLFSDKRVWIQRGERLLWAERTKTGRYVFTDGPEQGQRVKLLLFDRIGTGYPTPPLHRDFRALRSELGFDRARMVHLGTDQIVADLHYGTVWVRTLLASHEAHLDFVCDAPEPGAGQAMAAFRAERTRKEKVLRPLRSAILAGVQEGLPFDEPLTEYGQQDGKLRYRWLDAYQRGQNDYDFQGDKYYVFNVRGRPLVPEVCVDFVFDSFERASGTWWRPRGERRERVVGKLDFSSVPDEKRRRATSFIEYAQAHPESFEVDTLPESDRIPFKFPRKLSDFLVNQSERFQPGDVVLIRGYAPWDKPWKPRIMHFHSFFVYEGDPISGMPIALAGNPGRPLLQTWQFEAFRTPDRSIWYRIRPKLDWLESVVSSDDTGPSGPPPLTAELSERE
jgi:hypothetical protein